MRFVSRVSSLGGVRGPLFFNIYTDARTKIMKKTKHGTGQTKRKSAKVTESKESENTEKVGEKVNSLDEEDQGFGGWLRSTDGIETMKLFVIANSIVMFTTIVYPHAQTAFEIISEMIYGPDSLY